jgi:hypothetical protein
MAPVENRATPLLRVVRGEPSAAELAALVAVVTARATPGAQSGAAPRTAWDDPARLVRAAVSPGPGGWRASALPR